MPSSLIISPTMSESGQKITSPYGSWADRFISPFAPLISQHIPHLKALSLCGCHINGTDFVVMLECLRQLEHLDISYSTLKNSALEYIPRYCRHKLKTLNISGIFKFGRNRGETLILISTFCEALIEIIILDCPEIGWDVLDECIHLTGNRINYIHLLEK